MGEQNCWQAVVDAAVAEVQEAERVGDAERWATAMAVWDKMLDLEWQSAGEGQ